MDEGIKTQNKVEIKIEEPKRETETPEIKEIIKADEQKVESEIKEDEIKALESQNRSKRNRK